MDLTAQLSSPRYELRRILSRQLGYLRDDRREPSSGWTRSRVTPLQTQRRLREHEVTGLVEAYCAGATIKELAAKYGVHRFTVSRHLEQRRVPRRQRGFRPEDIPKAAELYKGGASLIQVAQEFGVNAETVRTTLRKAGVAIRPRRGWPAD